MRTPISIAVTALSGFFAVAIAQEYCVTCTGPDANYRCIIGGEPSLTAKSSRGQLLCITELARSGGHASCSVGRETGAPCQGELKTVMFPQAPMDPSAPPMAEGGPPPGVPGQDVQPGPSEEDMAGVAPEPAPDEPKPSTVADLTKKTIDKTGEGIEKAGNAVGNAVKKTWNCLSSFFGDC